MLRRKIFMSTSNIRYVFFYLGGGGGGGMGVKCSLLLKSTPNIFCGETSKMTSLCDQIPTISVPPNLIHLCSVNRLLSSHPVNQMSFTAADPI